MILSLIFNQTGTSLIMNESKEFMQETQHTQQTATWTAQNTDIETDNRIIKMK